MTVHGSIVFLCVRHLLKRIEEPMKQFESNQNVLAGKDAKRIIKVTVSGRPPYPSSSVRFGLSRVPLVWGAKRSF